MNEPSRWQRWKAFDRRSSDKVSRFLWLYLTPVIAAAVVVSSALSIGPAWRAHEGAGIRGMVTVTSKDCGRNSCSYTGDFVSNDGRDRRAGVGLASGFSDIAVGVRVVALDDGDPDNVYPPGGGHDWILTTIFLVGAVGTLGFWIYLVPVAAVRRRRRPVSGRVITSGPNVGARFTIVRLREGYDIGEVDAFVAQVGAGSITSAEARNVRFTPVHIRQGYDMGEVDDYVDGVEEQLSSVGR